MKFRSLIFSVVSILAIIYVLAASFQEGYAQRKRAKSIVGKDLLRIRAKIVEEMKLGNGLRVDFRDSLSLNSDGLFLSHWYIPFEQESDVPLSATGSYYWIEKLDGSSGKLLWMDHLAVHGRVGGRLIFGGIPITSRDNGLYSILSFDGVAFSEICTTDERVYRRGNECATYCGDGFLHQEWGDINLDGVDDISFHGELCNYCEGLELGFGYRNRKRPKEITPIAFTYQSVLVKGHDNCDSLIGFR